MRTVTYEQAVIEAAQNLVKVKGRHHSEQAYQRLVDAVNALAAAPDHPATAGDAEDAARLAAMADEWSRARRGVDCSMPIWDALCDAIGQDADGNGMRAAIDAAVRASKGGE